MAIYHFSAQIIGRSAGRSSVAASAYRAGAKMTDARTGEIHDFGRKGGVAHSEVMAPASAPAWMLDRSQLWNHVEGIERRKDAQLCREFNIALPKELDPAQQVALARHFVQAHFVRKGMVAQLDLHNLDGDNPHFHCMTTLRDIDGDGFGQKNRSWNDKALLEQWRQGWADIANRHLAKAGQTVRIDHRSLADQGITDREPIRRMNMHALSMERRTGEKSDQRLRMEAEMRERAQEAARAKISQADLSGQIHAAEIQASELQRELAKVVAPSRATADVRRDLDQVRASFRPAADVVADQPAVKQARERFERARQQQEEINDRLVKANDVLASTKRAARRGHDQVQAWKKDHPLRLWLHDHVHQSSTLRRLERQALSSQQAIEPAQNAVKKASVAAGKIGQVYTAARDDFLDVQGAAVDRLNQQRKPTEQLIDQLQKALDEGQARERQQAEQRRQAEQAEQRQKNLMGGIRLGGSDTPQRPDGRTRPRGG